jgi:hypothetical protein
MLVERVPEVKEQVQAASDVAVGIVYQLLKLTPFERDLYVNYLIENAE